ncbi:NACHT, LRR and PYD domains-containing protein 12-like [Gastrophryne carolinensis]
MPLVATHIRPSHRQGQHRLLETGTKHEVCLHTTLNHPEQLSLNRLFHWSYRYKSAPHVVVVSGVPGIGKTTMFQKLICDWANGKFYQRFAFIFYFHFEDLNSLDNSSLQSMILHQYPYLESQLEEILKDPNKLLFIFDGFDEYAEKVNFKSRRLCGNIEQAEDVGTLVVSLVRQSLLKGCSIILASRPDKLAEADMSVFRRVVEITGFLFKERKLYFESFFMNKELSDRAFDFVKQNGVLETFCYLPSFCQIICTVMSTFFDGQEATKDQPLPKTLTQLFVAFVANILSKQSSGNARDLLTSIGSMAEHGIMNHITRFEKQTLLRFNVDTTSEILPSFMKESKKAPNLFSFPYPMIQDFLGALTHYICYSPEKLQNSLEKVDSYNDKRGQIFVCFLCGLSDVTTRAILKPLLGDLSSNAAQDVLTWHQRSIPRALDTNSTSQEEKMKLLNTCFRLFETQNRKFILECLGQCKKFYFFDVHLTPLDCTVLTFILESCGENEELCLNDSALTRRNIAILAPSLHTVHSLSFSNSRMMSNDAVQSLASALSHPESKIHGMWLSMDGLTDRSCSYLGPAIRKNQSLRKLSLAYNELEGPHFCDLMEALSDPACKIEELYLNNAHLTDSSCPALLSGIRGNRSLKILNLSFNPLAGPHIDDLMSALSSPTCNIEQLWLEGISLTNEHLPSLVALSNNTHLTQLELSHNDDITDAGVDDLKELLLKSPSLRFLCIFLFHALSDETRKVFSELKAQKPGLDVWC